MITTTVDDSNVKPDKNDNKNISESPENINESNNNHFSISTLQPPSDSKVRYTPMISKAKPTLMTQSATASASVSASNSRPASWISTGTTRPLSTHSTLFDRASSPSLSREGSIKETKSLKQQASRNSLASALTAHLDRLFVARGGSDIDSASFHSQPYMSSPVTCTDQVQITSSNGCLTQGNSPSSDAGDDSFVTEDLRLKLLELAPSPPPVVPEPLEEADSELDSEGEEFNGGIHRRKYATEDILSEAWAKHRKHFFILSSAGKPIYSRYGDESQLSGLTGIIQAMVSFFLEDQDPIRCIHIGDQKVVFLLQDPLYYVMVSKTNEPELVLREQLHIFHQQVLSLVTQSQISKVFEKRRNYDLRQMLSGTEVFLDSLCKRLNSISPSHLFRSIRPQRLTRDLRMKLTTTLRFEPVDGLLYVMLVSRYRLLHVAHSKRVALHPTDLHLLLNLIHSSPNFYTPNQESWLPICLPKFNSTGFLHALIYPVSHSPLLSLILLTSDKDKFFELSQLKENIIDRLTQHQILSEIFTLMGEEAYLPTEFNSPGLRHFFFKNLNINQFIGSKFDSPFVEKEERLRIFSLYQSAYCRLHNPNKPLRLHFEVTEFEIVLGWITPSFELYATYDQFMTKSTILNSALTLIKGIKSQQDQLFITNIPTF